MTRVIDGGFAPPKVDGPGMAQRITVYSRALNLQVEGWLGEASPNVTGGYARWKIVNRPRRVGLTIFDGRDPFSVIVPMVLDEFRAGGSVEPECSRLERMALPPKPGEQPKIVRLLGDAVPHSELDWVINGIDWGDSIRTKNNGNRLRQEVTLTLLSYQDDDRVRPNKSKSGANSGKYGLYTVKAGDTLPKIAAHILGSSKRWKEIAKLNNIRDPKRLKVGQKLRVPKH